jgi:hypothetical protein
VEAVACEGTYVVPIAVDTPTAGVDLIPAEVDSTPPGLDTTIGVEVTIGIVTYPGVETG